MSAQQSEREVVASVHGKQVAACLDRYSLWVEIAGPRGGSPWQMAPSVARILANALNVAADKAENEQVDALGRAES